MTASRISAGGRRCAADLSNLDKTACFTLFALRQNKAACVHGVAVQDSKPVWVWIESTMIGDTGRKPTTKEVKAEIWMALVHGARGYGYFCHSFGHGPHPVFQEDAMLVDTEMAAAVKAINLGALDVNHRVLAHLASLPPSN